MDDVFTQIVFASRNKNLGPGDAVTTIGVGFRARPQQP
jgi:hypothetical protein